MIAAPERSRAGVLTGAALLLVTFLWYWPCLHHGLQSDDYLTVYYTDRTTGAVQWDRVFGEFSRAWFGAGDLYRPLVSLSFGIEHAFWPAPWARHAGNVLLLAITAMATAATAARLCPQRRSLGAWFAGLVVVLHPAAVEPTAWICARTTGMQMAAVALAGAWFVRARDRDRFPVAACGAFAAALLCKEGAVTAPLYLLLLDLLHAPADSWRARLRRQLPFACVLLLYFGWRVWLLGRSGGNAGDGVTASAGNVLTRLGQLAVPPDADGARAWASLPLLLFAIAGLWSRLSWRLLLLPLAAILLLAPTHHMPAVGAQLFGRLVFDAVPAVAVALALGAVSLPGARALAGSLPALGWLVLLAVTSRHHLAHAERNDRTARGVEHALVTAAEAATPARPFACTYLPRLPLFHDKLWGVLGLQPFAPRDLAVIGLPELLEPDERAPQFAHDAAPVHALLATGATVAQFQHEQARFQPLPPPTAGTLELAADAKEGHSFVAATAWPGTGVAAIEVVLPAPARQLRWRFLDDLPGKHAFGTATSPVHGTTAWLPTSHALPPVLLAGLGLPFRGVHLEVDGTAPPAGTRVVVHGTLPGRELPAVARGQTRSRAELFALTTSPPFAGPARCYVMLPTGVRHQDVPAGGAPMLDVLRDHLTWALDIYAPLTVHWFWQSLPDADGAPWRSARDWAIAR